LGEALCASFEHLNGRRECLVKQELRAPVEHILFVGIHARCLLVLRCRRNIVPRLFFDVAEKAMEFCRVPQSDQLLELLAGFVKSLGLLQSQGQVIPIVVSRGIDFLGTLQERNSTVNFSRFNVELAEIVIGIVALRFHSDEFLEPEFRLTCAMQRKKVCCQGGLRFRDTWFQLNGFGKVTIGLRLFSLSNVNQTQKFVDFKTGGSRLHQRFEFMLGRSVLLRFICGERGKKSAVGCILNLPPLRIRCPLLRNRHETQRVYRENHHQYADHTCRSSGSPNSRD